MRDSPVDLKQTRHAMLKSYPDVLDVEQLSAILTISTKTCYKLLREGKIVGIKVGRSYRIAKTNAFKYLLSNDREKG